MRTLLLVALLVAAAARADEPDKPAPAVIDAEQLLGMGREAEALRLIDAHLAQRSDDARAHHLRGVIRDSLGKPQTAIEDYSRAIELDPALPQPYQRRGVARFMAGEVAAAVADFDKYLELRPDQAAGHWQRGIALYYAGRFEEAARQFELHRTVNPQDVENSAWHFLCVAKWKNLDAARKALLPVKDDRRVPMMKVLELFTGKATPADVLADAKAGDVPAFERTRRVFYADLYIGLYHEAAGEAEKSARHLRTAAAADGISDYMHGVAKVHVARLKERTPQPSEK